MFKMVKVYHLIKYVCGWIRLDVFLGRKKMSLCKMTWMSLCFFILCNKGILEFREINNLHTLYKNIINRHFSNQALKRKSLFGSK